MLAVILTLSALCSADAPNPDNSLAWVRFEKAKDVYSTTPYLWLGHGEIALVIDVAPGPGHVLELLWGAKGDVRSATASINGREVKIREGGYNGFRWIAVPLPPEIVGDRYEVTLKQAGSPQAFIAAVRMSGGDDPGPLDREKPAYKITFKAPVAQGDAFAKMRAIWDREPPARAEVPAVGSQEAAFRRAEINSRQAAEAFFRCRRFIDGWLTHADATTGLIPRNLSRNRDFWNAKDAAADNYPFMVITSAMTDRPLFEGRMLDMLRTETRLTCRIGRMPDDWSFTKQDFVDAEANLDKIIFGSSEYCKDGLLAVTEWLGPCPWTDRMLGILDDIWQHAPVETRWGNIPSTNTEINGEMLQVLCRAYWMTGDKKYLGYALRIGDYYLLGDHHPTRDADSLRLIAHGGEIVSGLCELYVTVHFADRPKKEAYREPLHEMLDRILQVGTNEHGMVYTSIHPQTGAHDKRICDTWGYTYNGYYSVYLVDKTEAYRQAVLRALGNMNEHYRDYGWEGGSNDGYADSIESALNLYNREAVPSVAEWIDHEIRYMFRRQKPDGVIEGWHGDGNSARTWLLYALWKTQGLTVRPWRADLRFGAVRRGDELLIHVAADEPWDGRLIFDVPRHRDYLKLPIDYPRLNQFPEWFTVAAAKRYAVQDASEESPRMFTGRQLREGLPVSVKRESVVRLVVE